VAQSQVLVSPDNHIEDVPSLLRQLATSLATGGHLALADLEKEDGNFHADKSGIAHFGFEPSLQA
jgi:hypothetical protein